LQQVTYLDPSVFNPPQQSQFVEAPQSNPYFAQDSKPPQFIIQNPQPAPYVAQDPQPAPDVDEDPQPAPHAAEISQPFPYVVVIPPPPTRLSLNLSKRYSYSAKFEEQCAEIERIWFTKEPPPMKEFDTFTHKLVDAFGEALLLDADIAAGVTCLSEKEILERLKTPDLICQPYRFAKLPLDVQEYYRTFPYVQDCLKMYEKQPEEPAIENVALVQEPSKENIPLSQEPEPSFEATLRQLGNLSLRVPLSVKIPDDQLEFAPRPRKPQRGGRQTNYRRKRGPMVMSDSNWKC